MLKRRLEDLVQKTNLMETRLNGSEKQNDLDRASQAELTDKIKVLDSKLARAKKVAAYMEKQIKVKAIKLGNETQC